MGISTTTNRLAFQGDGNTKAFSFPYYFFATTDLKVYKYDTLLGVITNLTLASDYTVTGTPNYQGIYPSGGTVTTLAATAPLTTDYIVILRNPPETQTFNILENGIIPSQTLIQQLDYMTLLIQKLQDQVNRCIQLPAGLGETFSTVLPDDTALNKDSFVHVKHDGTGIELTDAAPLYRAVPIVFGDLSNAGLSVSIPLFTLPAKAILTALAIKHSVPFTGTGVATIYAQVGVSGGLDKFIDFYDIHQSAGDTTFDNVASGYIGSWANDTIVYLTCIATGANLDQLAAGALTAYYSYVMVE
jgi:hypothetical protein